MARRIISHSESRNYLKGSIPIHSVRGKAAAIQRENPVCFQLFSQHNQRGVGEIHRDIAISLHQNRNTLQAFRRGGNQVKRASEDKLETSFLRAPLGSDQIKCFGQYGFRGDDGPGPLLQRRDAITVQLLVPVHERYEGAGIQQKLSGHGANGGSGTRGGADPSRAGRWQRCREDRERVRWGAPPAGCPGIAPKPRGPLPIVCVLAVWLTALIWRQDPLAIASLIDAPYKCLLFVLQCNATTCKCPT